MLNRRISRLCDSAVEFDVRGEKLARNYKDLPNVPEERAQGVLGRQTAVKGFLNSICIVINLWIHELMIHHAQGQRIKIQLTSCMQKLLPKSYALTANGFVTSLTTFQIL